MWAILLSKGEEVVSQSRVSWKNICFMLLLVVFYISKEIEEVFSQLKNFFIEKIMYLKQEKNGKNGKLFVDNIV